MGNFLSHPPRMTFVEAAVALLEKAGTQLPVEKLADLAVERGLLDKPGQNPLGSMKRQLTAELRRGAAARVARVDKDVWALPKAEPTDEEKQLAELYGDDLEPVAAYTEYRDAQTADEDRPMRKEIIPKAEQRRQRRQRRERGGRARGRDRDRNRDRKQKRAHTEPIEVSGLDLAGAALQVLRANDQRHPMTARRIADSLHGRGLIPGAPPKPARAIKAALLHAASTRRARGLRPKAAYLGNDQFVLASRDLGADLKAAEDVVEGAIGNLEAATRRALGERLAKLSVSELERAVGLYLHAAGWRDLRWVKRVGKSAYAQGMAPGTDDVWLIGVRTGPTPVDRRGVGELRAGVQAKSLTAGLLLSPVELSADASEELDCDGPPVQLLAGPAFVAALASVGVCVTAQAAPVLYLDPQFFAEIRDE